MNPLQSLIATGTKLWLDSVDPDLVRRDRAIGATGATSNPIIVADLVASGRYDDFIVRAVDDGLTDQQIAWQLTDHLVRTAQEVFLPVWEQTRGNDGYVSFEVDPLLEDPDVNLPHAQRVARYIELGQEWSAGQKNRLIKVPATPAGLDALEPLAAAGVRLNVTLLFTSRQYRAARDAIWRGARAAATGTASRASIASLFLDSTCIRRKRSRGFRPLPKAKWASSTPSGSGRRTRRFGPSGPRRWQQEIVFASTGTKKPGEPPWKYVEAFAGSDIETNPPATNDAVAHSGRSLHAPRRYPPPGRSGGGDRSAGRHGAAGSHALGRGDRQVCPTAAGAAGTHCRETPDPCRGTGARGQGPGARERLGEHATPPRAPAVPGGSLLT